MKTILVGGGGHALSLLEILPNYGQITGYADIQQSNEMPIPYLGTDEEVLAQYRPDEYDIHVTLVYTSDINLSLRRKIIERYHGYSFHTFEAHTALVTAHTTIGDGCAIMERAVVNRSVICKNVIINTGAIIEHGCQIGNNVFIGPGAIVCGGVSIGDNTLIGAGAVIRDDVAIASETVIGMGSVVTKSILQGGTFIGNPAKMIMKNE